MHLKSNMDRFIVLIRKSNKVDYKYLKSNMDRFIVVILAQFYQQIYI